MDFHDKENLLTNKHSLDWGKTLDYAVHNEKAFVWNRSIKIAVLTFLALRLWFTTLGIIGVTFRPMVNIEPQNAHSDAVIQELNSTNFQRLFLSPWYRFDTIHYLEIAENGYQADDHNSAFAPLFPALIHLVNFVIPSAMGSAMLVSNLGALVSIWLYLLLISRYFTKTISTHSLLWLAVFPSTFILFQPYTESLFLGITLACLLFIQRRSWLLAGFFAALATLTRFQGIFLVVIFLWISFSVLRQHEKFSIRRDWVVPLVGVVLPVIFLTIYLVILKFHFNALLPWEGLAAGWNERFGWPWEGVIGNFRGLFSHPPKELVAGLFLDLAAAISIPIILIQCRKQTPTGWLIFFWLLYLTSITKINPAGTLHSTFRYILPILSVYLFLNMILVKKWQRLVGLAISLSVQAALFLMFYLWVWVF